MEGDLAGPDKEHQEVSMLALHLLQAALVHVNTLLVQRVLSEPAWKERFTDEDRRGLTALFWSNVRPYGLFELEAAWSPAVASIVDEHNRRADPRADAERIGPAQRFALDLLRDPAVALPTGAGAADEALSVERSSSVRQALSEIRRLLVEGEMSRDDGARRVVDVVKEFGLQPVEPPPALSPITEEDVGVVCWMAVRPES